MDTPPPTVVKTVNSGPLQIKGSFVVVDHDGAEFPVPRRTVLLCRCGHSENKPFCDGSHLRNGFAATERAPGESAGS